MSGALTPPPAASFRELSGRPVHFSGIVGVDHAWRPVTSSFDEELRAVFANLDVALGSAGLRRENIVAVRGYLADLSLFDEYNAQWINYFGESPPARTTVGADLHPPFRVEIEVIASRPT